MTHSFASSPHQRDLESPAWAEGRIFGNARSPATRSNSQTRARFAALQWLWDYSDLRSVRHCRRSAIPGELVTVGIAGGLASARRLRSCSSVWACPVCSHAQWSERQRELSHLLRSARASGMSVALITLTARHRRSDDLSGLLDGLRDAWKAVQDSKAVRTRSREAFVAGFVRRTEASWGERFGWHPHLHILVFGEPGDPEAGYRQLGSEMFSAWSSSLVKAGMAAPLRDSGGLHVKVLDISNAEMAAAGYLTEDGAYYSTESRAASELSDSGGKRAKRGNLTTWQLLDRARSGNKTARALWGDWERATKGRKPWAVSRALRVLAADYCEPVEVAPEYHAVGALTNAGWRIVCADPDGPSEFLGEIEDAYRAAARRSHPDEDDDGDQETRGLRAAALAFL